MSGRGKGKTGKKAVSRSAKAGLQFPVGRVARYLKAGKYATRVGAGAPPHTLAAVLEYLAAEVLDSPATPPATTRRPASCPATSSWPSATTRTHTKLLGTVTIASGGVHPNIHSVHTHTRKGAKGNTHTASQEY